MIFLDGAPKSDFLKLVGETTRASYQTPYSESVEGFFAVRFQLIMLCSVHCKNHQINIIYSIFAYCFYFQDCFPKLKILKLAMKNIP